MISLKNKTITIDYDQPPILGEENRIGQMLLISRLLRARHELPTNPVTDEDHAKIAEFSRKIEYLRKHLFPSLRDSAADLLTWVPNVQSSLADHQSYIQTRSDQNVSSVNIPAGAAAPATELAFPSQNSRFAIRNPQFENPNPDRSPSAPNRPEPDKPRADTAHQPNANRTETEQKPDTEITSSSSTGSSENHKNKKSPTDPIFLRLDKLPESDKAFIRFQIDNGWRDGPLAIKLNKPRPEGLGIATSRSSVRRFRESHQTRLAAERARLARRYLNQAVAAADTADDYNQATAHLFHARLFEAAIDPDFPVDQIPKLARGLHQLRATQLAERKLALAEQRTKHHPPPQTQ